MITAFTNDGKFENFTFCIESLLLHSIVTSPVFNVLSIVPIVPVKNTEFPNNTNGAYVMLPYSTLFTEIVTNFIFAPEVLYINKLLKTCLLFHNTVAIQETHGFAPNVAQLFETFIVKPFFVTDP